MKQGIKRVYNSPQFERYGNVQELTHNTGHNYTGPNDNGNSAKGTYNRTH